MKWNVEQIVTVTKGQLLRLGKTEFEAFGIDSRNIKQDALFFALKGEKTDGHLFLEDALRRGAAGAVIEQDLDAERFPFTLIRVGDSLKALHDLGTFVRATSRAKFIGITGSSGKTSTKEFAAAFLAQKYSVFKNEGNLNSITGLPLSLLTLERQEYAVFEVAMNKPGEIAALSRVLLPQIGVLLNVNTVHLGQFLSIEAIADEKLSLLEGMTPDSTVIYNADDPLVRSRIRAFHGHNLSFGFSATADLRISDASQKGVKGLQAVFVWKSDRVPVQTSLCGVGNLYNVAAAAATALACNLSWNEIQRAISQLQPYRQRGVLIPVRGIHIYDDSYNSNPKALELALELIRQSEGYKRKVAVLGDMLELGPEEREFHRRAGEQVAVNHFDVLITAGPLSKYMVDAARQRGMKEVYETANSEEAAEAAARAVREGDLVLVKGSRRIKMERVVERLQNNADRETHR